MDELSDRNAARAIFVHCVEQVLDRFHLPHKPTNQLCVNTAGLTWEADRRKDAPHLGVRQVQHADDGGGQAFQFRIRLRAEQTRRRLPHPARQPLRNEPRHEPRADLRANNNKKNKTKDEEAT